MDPPVYGRGAKNEVWKLEEDLSPFVERVTKLLSENALAVLLNGYASGYTHTTYKQVLEDSISKSGDFSSGELAIKEFSGDRLLTCGIFAKWEK